MFSYKELFDKVLKLFQESSANKIFHIFFIEYILHHLGEFQIRNDEALEVCRDMAVIYPAAFPDSSVNVIKFMSWKHRLKISDEYSAEEIDFFGFEFLKVFTRKVISNNSFSE